MQTSAAALGSLLAWRGELAYSSTDIPRNRFYKIVFDERREVCRHFADEAKRHGTSALGIRDDVTALWYDDLRIQLQEQTTLIAGLTTEPVAYYLTAFARDVGYHQVVRGDHVFRGGAVDHRLTAPNYFTAKAFALTNGSPRWSRMLARLMHEYNPQAERAPRTTIGTHVHVRSDDPNRLVSWVLAPIYT